MLELMLESLYIIYINGGEAVEKSQEFLIETDQIGATL